MTDMEDRFRSLDRVPMPELWGEATLRAVAEPQAASQIRTNYILPLGLVTAAVAIALIVGLGLLWGPTIGTPDPLPTPAASPTPAGQLGEWFGPVRTDLGQAVVPHALDDEVGAWAWADPSDSGMGWVDITRASFNDLNAGSWNIELASWPPPATGQGGADLIVAHGLVLDTTGDGVADYVVGVDDDAPQPGDFRAWVTNLATGVTVEQGEPPYGYPVEFGHFGMAGPSPTVGLTFLPGSEPADFDIESVRYYVWTSVTEAGEVVAWDYAPDAAWLGSPYAPIVSGWPSGGPNPPGEYSFGASANPNVGRYGWMHNGYHDIAEGEEVTIEFFSGELGPRGTTPVTIDGYPGTFQESIDAIGRLRQVWMVDIDGASFTVVVLADPQAKAAHLAEARAIIESIRAVPPADGERVRQLIFTLPAGWDSG